MRQPPLDNGCSEQEPQVDQGMLHQVVMAAQGPHFRFSYKELGYDNKIEDVHELQRDKAVSKNHLKSEGMLERKSMIVSDLSYALSLFWHGKAVG